MDTALHGALNGWDIVLWVGFFLVAPRVLAWGYRRPRVKVVVRQMAEPEARREESPQLKLAV